MTDVILYFDGGCQHNGAANATGTFGGCLFAKRTGEPLAEWSGSVEAALVTNNIAEWVGLVEGLRLVKESGRLVSRLDIRGDSRLVCNQLRGRWRCRKPHLAVLRDQARRLLDAIGCEWRVTWIPREQNAVADALTRRGPPAIARR